jgi:hypothetical protein
MRPRYVVGLVPPEITKMYRKVHPKMVTASVCSVYLCSVYLCSVACQALSHCQSSYLHRVPVDGSYKALADSDVSFGDGGYAELSYPLYVSGEKVCALSVASSHS